MVRQTKTQAIITAATTRSYNSVRESTLFKVPELRNEIYFWVFHKSEDAFNRATGIYEEKLNTHSSETICGGFNLLLACKLILREAHGFLWDHQIFRMRTQQMSGLDVQPADIPTLTPVALTEVMTTSKRKVLKQVRHVEMTVDDLNHSRIQLDRFKKMPDLQTVHIRMSHYDEASYEAELEELCMNVGRGLPAFRISMARSFFYKLSKHIPTAQMVIFSVGSRKGLEPYTRMADDTVYHLAGSIGTHFKTAFEPLEWFSGRIEGDDILRFMFVRKGCTDMRIRGTLAYALQPNVEGRIKHRPRYDWTTRKWVLID